jgi:hypothetical protein
MTVHEVMERGWSPSHPGERIQSLTQIGDFVIILTDSRIYRAHSDRYNDFMVDLIGHLS